MAYINPLEQINSRPSGFTSAPLPPPRTVMPTSRTNATPTRGGASKPRNINDVIASNAGKMRAGQQPAKEEDDGNPFGRGLGFLLNNPITQTALKPLQALDYGRRLVTLGAEEGSELLSGWLGMEDEFGTKFNEDGTRSEFGNQSNWDKLNDPTYGFGDLVKVGDMLPGTWNDQWGNRVGGLVGDIALDPLSYLTAGVGGVVGKGGRSLYSSMARQAGREAAERALKEGAEELAVNAIRKKWDDAATEIGRYGPGAIKDKEVLQALNFQQGLRWGSMKPGQGYRIGGNTVVGDALGEVARRTNRAVGGVRAKFYDTGVGGTLASWRTPQALIRAHEVIRSGKTEAAGGMEMGAALALTDFHRAQQIGSNSFRGRAERTYRQIGGRKVRGQGALEATRVAETAGVRNEWNDYADELVQVASEYGVAIPVRQDYVPHILTADAQDLLRGNEDLRSTFGVTVSHLDDPSGVTMARELTGGKHTIQGVEVDFGKGTIDEINAEMAKKFGVKKFLDNNITEIYSKYVSRLASDAGLMSGLREVADKYPELLAASDNPSALLNAFTDVVDEAATKLANKEAVTELRARLVNANRAIGEAEDRAEEAVMKGQSILADEAGENLSALRTMRRETKAELTKLERTEKSLVKRRDKVVDQLSAEIIDMDERADVLRRELDVLREREANAINAIENAPTAAETRSRKASRAAQIGNARRTKQAELELLEEERELLREVNRRIKYADVKEAIVTGRLESTGVTPRMPPDDVLVRGARPSTELTAAGYNQPISESFTSLYGGDVVVDDAFVTIGPAQRLYNQMVESGELAAMPQGPQKNAIIGAANRERAANLNRARQIPVDNGPDVPLGFKPEGVAGSGRTKEELTADIMREAEARRAAAEVEVAGRPAPVQVDQAPPALTRNEQRKLSRAVDRETRTTEQLREVLDSPQGQQWIDEWEQIENVGYLRNPNRWGQEQEGLGNRVRGTELRESDVIPGPLQAELDAAKSRVKALKTAPDLKTKAGRNEGAIKFVKAELRKRMARMREIEETLDKARNASGFGETRRVTQSIQPPFDYKADDFTKTVPPSRSSRGIIDQETERMQALAVEIRDLEERLAYLTGVQGVTQTSELNRGAQRAKIASAEAKVKKLESQVNAIKRKGQKTRDKVARLEETLAEARSTQRQLEAKTRPKPTVATDQSHLELEAIKRRIAIDEAEALRTVDRQARSASSGALVPDRTMATSPEGFATRTRIPGRSQIEADLASVRDAGQRFQLPPKGTKARELLDDRSRSFAERVGDKNQMQVAEDVLQSSQVVEPYRSSLLEMGAITEFEANRHVTQMFEVRAAIMDHTKWKDPVSRQNLDNAIDDLRRTNEFLIRYSKILSEEGMEPSDALANRVLRRVIDNDIEALDADISALRSGRKEYVDREAEDLVRVLEDTIEQLEYASTKKQQANALLRPDKKRAPDVRDLSPSERIALHEENIRVATDDPWNREQALKDAKKRLNKAVKKGDDKEAALAQKQIDNQTKKIQENKDYIAGQIAAIAGLRDKTMSSRQEEIVAALESLADAPMSPAAQEVLARAMSQQDLFALKKFSKKAGLRGSEGDLEFLEFIDILLERQGIETDSLKLLSPMEQLQMGLRFQAARDYQNAKDLFAETFQMLGLRRKGDLSMERTVGYNQATRTHYREAARTAIREKLERERGMSSADWIMRDMEARKRRLQTINRGIGKQDYKTGEIVESLPQGNVTELFGPTDRLPDISRPTISGEAGPLEQLRDARNAGREAVKSEGSFEGLPFVEWREVLFGDVARVRPTQPMIRPQGEAAARFLRETQQGIPRPAGAFTSESPASQVRVLNDQLEDFGAAEAGLRDVVARQQRVRPVAQEIADGLEQSIAGREQKISSLDDIINSAGTPLFPEVEGTAARVQQQFDQKIGPREEELGQLTVEKAAREKAIDKTLKEIDPQLVKTREAIRSTEELLSGSPQAYNERIAEAQRVADLVTKKSVNMTQGQWGAASVAEDFEKAMAGMGLPAAEEAMVRSLLGEAVLADREVEALKRGAAALEAAIAKGDANKLRVMTESVMLPNWKPMAEVLTKGAATEGDQAVSYIMEQSLARQFTRIDEALKSNRFWKAVEAYTRFFKTYATARPDFHVRNGISAMFMNTSDGVPISYNFKAMQAWRRLSESPDDFMAGLLKKPDLKSDFVGLTNKQLHDAITVAWGTGAGGQFAERGVGGTSNRAIINNPWTRGSQRIGEYVEGPVRLAAAMDSIKRGRSVAEAYERVARLQFDYSDVSRFDQYAKRIIPFWTFMSRNIPLQLTQMWTKPRTYAYYNSFVRNFIVDADPLAPEYWATSGGFPIMQGEKGTEDQTWFMPDLAHNRIGSDIESMIGLATLSDAGFATSASPLFITPAELATNTDFFTGRKYDEADVLKLGGLEKIIQPITDTIGMSKNGVIDEQILRAMRGLAPMWDQASRVAPDLVTGGSSDLDKERQAQTILRYLGVYPARKLGPVQRETVARSNYYDQRDKLAQQQAYQRALAGG